MAAIVPIVDSMLDAADDVHRAAFAQGLEQRSHVERLCPRAHRIVTTRALTPHFDLRQKEVTRNVLDEISV
jgi:hypothetical protein